MSRAAAAAASLAQGRVRWSWWHIRGRATAANWPMWGMWAK